MPTSLIRFFGPGIVLDRAGKQVAIRSRKLLALFAYLMTEQQVAHSRAHLLALFWPDLATADAQNNLRVSLNRLRAIARKIAAEGAGSGDLLLVDRYTVQIQAGWAEFADSHQFNQLLELTRHHKHGNRNRCAECQRHLQRAVQLYQGDFLEGLGLEECTAFEEWLFMQRERLRVLLLEAYQDLGDYAESTGDLAAARSYCEKQLELEPLRETTYRQLMRLLAAQGDRSGALAVFERCRKWLRQELGLDPEPETLDLHYQLLHSARPVSGQRVVPAQASFGVERPAHNLPQQLTPFFGREEELAQLHLRLSTPSYRLLSIVGPGGIGKSRLAQQVAARQLNNFRDGVYFVPLAQTPAVDLIPAAIAETVGLTFTAHPKSQAEQLIDMLSSRQLLLVLDNFEHLIAGADLLLALLQQAPNLMLLVTSREQLNLQAEDLFDLQGLPVPETSEEAAVLHYAAVRLFVDRAQRLDKRFHLTAVQLPHVVRICQLVEGLPLAIELAATWVRDFNCQEIVTELASGLDGLEATLRDIAPQHRSLRAVFNTSWRLLSLAEQRVLAKLTVFRGGFSLEAASAIADASAALLHSLRNKSLLRNAGTRRSDMHALVQQFTAEHLNADRRLTESTQNAHTHYFLTLLTERAIDLDTNNARQAITMIQADWENVSLAWQRAVSAGWLKLLADALDGFVLFCDLSGRFQEAQSLLENSLSGLEQLPLNSPVQISGQRDELRCRFLTALAYFCERCCLYERTLELTMQSLTLAQEIGNQKEIIHNYITQAAAYKLASNFAKAEKVATRALKLAQEAKLELSAALALDILGIIALRMGEFERASHHFQQVLAIHKKTGRIEQRGRAAIGLLGRLATEQGRYDVALQNGQSYLQSCQAVDDRRSTAQAQHYLARLWMLLGDFEPAIALETQSIESSSAIGDRELTSLSLHTRAAARRALGQLAEALEDATESTALARTLDAPFALGFGLGQLAVVQMLLAKNKADWEEAAKNFREAAAVLVRIGKPISGYEARIGLADLAYRCGNLPEAYQQIAPILPHLPLTATNGWDEPIRAYVVCVRILRATGNPLAQQLLDQGRHLLDCLARNITDHHHQQNFLNAIPTHRDLQAEAEKMATSWALSFAKTD